MKSNIKVVPTAFGQMAIHKLDKYVGRSFDLLGEYCTAELATIKAFTDEQSIIVDVGANIGSLTIPMAQHVKHVFAMEPVPRIYNLLVTNLTLNEQINVIPMNLAAGSEEKTLTFPDLNYDIVNNFGASELKPTDGHNEIESVPVNADCDLIKIDVEGMELDVLRGATPMIKRCSPVLFVENDRQKTGEKLISYIEDVLGYQCYWHVFPLFNPLNHNGVKENPFSDGNGNYEVCVNMLCLPKGTPFDMLPKATKGSFKDRFNYVGGKHVQR